MKFSAAAKVLFATLPVSSAFLDLGFLEDLLDPIVDLTLIEDDPSDPKFCYDPTDESCGPENWQFLHFTDKVNECGEDRQSPIKITSTTQCTPVTYSFHAGTCKYGDLEYIINDHSIKAEYPSGCDSPEVTIGSLVYKAVQWHIHLGQEHSIDDEFASASVHIVHALKSNPNNENAEPFAVVGYGLKAGTVIGDNNPHLDRMIHGFGDTADDTSIHCLSLDYPEFFWRGVDAPITPADPYAILPTQATFYQYRGSLTTPPCSEVVFWNFLSEPVFASVAQIDFINRLILGYVDPATCTKGTVADPKTGNTSRPPFDPAGRTVTKVGSC